MSNPMATPLVILAPPGTSRPWGTRGHMSHSVPPAPSCGSRGWVRPGSKWTSGDSFPPPLRVTSPDLPTFCVRVRVHACACVLAPPAHSCPTLMLACLMPSLCNSKSILQPGLLRPQFPQQKESVAERRPGRTQPLVYCGPESHMTAGLRPPQHRRLFLHPQGPDHRLLCSPVTPHLLALVAPRLGDFGGPGAAQLGMSVPPAQGTDGQPRKPVTPPVTLALTVHCVGGAVPT